MKKLNELYEAPCMEITEMQVEQCILSASYGDAGDAGQKSGYLKWEGEDTFDL